MTTVATEFDRFPTVFRPFSDQEVSENGSWTFQVHQQVFISITTSDMFLASLLLLLHPISGAFMKEPDGFEADQEAEQEVDQAADPEANLEAVKSVQWP